MRKLLFCLLLGLAPFGLHSDDDACCEETKSYLFELTTGYRQDQLKIHVTPPTPDSTVASINNWKDVDLFQVRLTFKAETCYCTYSRAYFNYGRLVEFHQDFVSPTLVLDPSKTHNEKGRVYDTEYACGFSLYLCDSIRLTPITGYSYHRTEFDSHNRVPRTIPVDSPDAERLDYFKVVAKQRTTWQAPFVGMEMELLFCNSTRVCLNGQYLWAHYNNHGKAHEKYNQNYRYKQRANGHGLITYGEIGYSFLQDWECVLAGGYQYWDAKGGKDHTKYSTNTDTEIKSHLHSVSWQSYELSLGLAHIF